MDGIRLITIKILESTPEIRTDLIYLIEPIGSLVSGNTRLRLRGKPTNSESWRMEKGDKEIRINQVRECPRQSITCVHIR